MIGFFRKYERTFFLIVFAPTIVGLGVTGVVMQVAQRQSAQSIGKIFGEDIKADDFQEEVGTYERLLQRGREGTSEERTDEAWKFLAYLRYAESHGVRATHDEVGRQINETLKFQIAQLKAGEEMFRRGITRDNPRFEREVQAELWRQIQKAGDRPVSLDEYEKVVKQSFGLSIAEYENFKTKEAVVSKLFNEVLPAAASASPEEVWRKYEEKSQKREGEILALRAQDNRPTADATTEDDVKQFFEMNRDIYDEPRRVDIEFAAAPFEKTRLEVLNPPPTEAELRAFYEKRKDELYHGPPVLNKDGTSGISTQTKAFEEVKLDVAKRVIDDKAKERADALLDKVTTKLAAQAKEKKPYDFKAAVDEVNAAEKTQTLVRVTTGLVEEPAIEQHGLIASLAALRWFRVADSGRPSSVLSGDKASFILCSREIKVERNPEYDEVKVQSRKDYVEPSEKELKRWHKARQEKYKTEESYRVDVAYTDYDEIAKHKDSAPKPEELEKYFKDNAKKWEGKKLDDVKADVEKAFRAERAKELSKKALAKVRELAQQKISEHATDPLAITNHPSVPSFMNRKSFPMLERAKILEEPWLKGAATAIFPSAKESVSETIERGDGKGELVFIVRDRTEAKPNEFEKVRAKVRDDVLDERGLLRARSAAEKLQRELGDLRGEALAKAIAAKKLTIMKTGFLTKDIGGAVIEGIPSELAGRVVLEVFAAETGGGFEKIIEDAPELKVLLVRCAQKQAPSEDGFATQRDEIRHDVLEKNRQEMKGRMIDEITLAAKGVSDAHVQFFRERTESKDGAQLVKVRQIFLPPDAKLISDWIDKEALKVVDAAEAAIKGGMKFEGAVNKFSEDEATRGVGGLRPRYARGDLSKDHGDEFEDKLFRTRPEDGVVRIKSNKGYHLVKVENVETGQRVLLTFRQILVKTDADTRKLPADIREAAEKKSKETMEAAKKRLDAGEQFAVVAHDVGLETEPYGRGEPFEAEWTTPFTRAALAAPLEEVTDPVEVKDAAGSTWQIFACSRDSDERTPPWQAPKRTARLVNHMQFASKDDAVAAKKALDEKLDAQSKERGGSPHWPEIVRAFRAIARTRSQASTAAKGGAFGALRLGASMPPEPNTRAYGDAFLEKVVALKPGERSDVFRSETGFHVVEVVELQTKPDEASGRDRRRVAYILHGTEWD